MGPFAIFLRLTGTRLQFEIRIFFEFHEFANLIKFEVVLSFMVIAELVKRNQGIANCRVGLENRRKTLKVVIRGGGGGIMRDG